MRDCPAGPVVKTLHFHCRRPSLIPGQGTKIPHVRRCGPQKNKIKKSSDLRFLKLLLWLQAFLFSRPCHLQTLGKVFVWVSMFNCLPLNFSERFSLDDSQRLLLSLLYSFNILKCPQVFRSLAWRRQRRSVKMLKWKLGNPTSVKFKNRQN